MNSLSLEIVRANSEALQARLRLDARQPYLNDHRPGEFPLLGTAMGIEIMKVAAATLAPGMRVRTVESVENHSAFILGAGVDPLVEVSASLASRSNGRWVIASELYSRSENAERVLHFRARLHLDRRRASVPVSMWRAPGTANQVTAAEIYALFFHGPAFRVIGGAARHDERMFSRLAEPLSRLFVSPSRASRVPQLVELALQSAGLFEVAVNKRMMIPHRILRLELHGDELHDDEPAPSHRAFWAVAQRTRRVGSEAADLDVSVIDDTGRTYLSVFGYRTLPLAFPIDPSALTLLHGKFA